MVAEVKPVLDCVDMEVAPQPDDRPPRPNTIIDRCKAAWENFKSFNRKMRWRTQRRSWPATSIYSAKWIERAKRNDLLGE